MATAFLPRTATPEKPAPAFVFIAGRGGTIYSHRLASEGSVGSFDRDERWPAEEMVKRGYAMVAYDCTDVAEDDYSAFRADVFRCFTKPEDRTDTSWATISAWAWGASRVLDWIETERAIDAAHVGIVGLSRRGKTALWAGANDTRFAMVCSCGSGCSGSRLNRIDIPQREPFWHLQAVQFFWFCGNARKWAGLENFMPCDVNSLAACVAPRIFVPTTGDLDSMAAPTGDFWTAYLASPVWRLYGLDGIDPSETFPDHAGVLVGRKDLKGFVYHNYHVGGHCVEAYDWNRFMDIADAHGWRK